MRRIVAIGAICGGLAAATACSVPSPWDYKVPNLAAVQPPGNFTADRQACDQQFPLVVGSYVARATCVNAAVEKDAIPFSPHTDLLRMGEQVRLKYARMVDAGALLPADGERKIAEAEEIVAQAIRDRDTGREQVADHRVDYLKTLLD